jgi:hypothetical protein
LLGNLGTSTSSKEESLQGEAVDEVLAVLAVLDIANVVTLRA